MSKNIFLMGIKHSGKSTLGKMLAKELNKEFFDTDNLIEEFYCSEKKLVDKLSFREIYKIEGAEGFQKIEASVCKWIKENVCDSVVSFGGGVIENKEAVDYLIGAGVFVYLKEDIDTLYKRIVANGIPPFLSEGDPYENFLILYERRAKLYQKKADIIVELKGAGINEAFQLLKLKLV